MTVAEQLEIFREHYHSIRVIVMDDLLSYKKKMGSARRWAAEANELIKELKLPDIIAVPNEGLFSDTFVVKKK